MWLIALAQAASAGDIDLSASFAFAPGSKRDDLLSWAQDHYGAAIGVRWQPDRFGLALTAEQHISSEPYFGFRFPEDPKPPPTDLSTIATRASLVFDFIPLDGLIYVAGVPHAFRIHAGGGAGLVYTRDDLEAMQKTTDPAAVATEKQVHPSIELAASFDLALTDTLLWTIGVANSRYIEVVDSTTLTNESVVTWATGPTFAF